MAIRVMSVGVLLMLPLPGAAAAQDRDRFSVNAAIGTPVNGPGFVTAGAFGFSPVSRAEFLVTLESIILPFEREEFAGGYSLTRGGTLMFVGGEVRLSLFPAGRVSPFLLAGLGAGTSRPTVNAEFPDEVENGLRVVYLGAGVRMPLRGGISLTADARGMLAEEDNDGVLGLLPVRVGFAWHF